MLNAVITCLNVHACTHTLPPSLTLSLYCVCVCVPLGAGQGHLADVLLSQFYRNCFQISDHQELERETAEDMKQADGYTMVALTCV